MSWQYLPAWQGISGVNKQTRSPTLRQKIKGWQGTPFLGNLSQAQ